MVTCFIQKQCDLLMLIFHSTSHIANGGRLSKCGEIMRENWDEIFRPECECWVEEFGPLDVEVLSPSHPSVYVYITDNSFQWCCTVEINYRS